MNLDALLDAWPIPHARTLVPVSSGRNNLSRFVATTAGTYFLRVYQNTNDSARISYEHALLEQLRRQGLPFALPQPLATDAGDTYLLTTDDAGAVAAALFPAIPGRRPERGDSAQTLLCAAALRELDDALAHIEIAPSLPAQPLPMFGDLIGIHPLAPDPQAMVARLPVASEQRARLQALFADLVALVPPLYDQLPRQLIHADFCRGNVLVQAGRVSGVLDFEFASPDLRAMDFVVGLWSFGINARDTAGLWSLLAAFARGYQRGGALATEEIMALPLLLRLREAAGLVHWVGRLRQGLATEEQIVCRVNDLLSVDDWLHTYRERLCQTVAAAVP